MSDFADKKLIRADWETNEIRTEVLKSIVNTYRSLEAVLGKESKAAEEAVQSILVNKQYYDELAIDSPKALTIAVAEYTANVLGIKVSIVENGGKSTLVFEGSAFVNKLATTQELTTELSEKLVRAYKNGLADLGGYFGYRTEVSSVQPDFIVSFSK